MRKSYSENERRLALYAVEVVMNNGGYCTFDQFDDGMKKYNYWAPIHWISGWGTPWLKKSNDDKMCAFIACDLGLINQSSDGYELRR